MLAALGQVTKERVFLHVVEFCMGPEVSAANVLYFSRSLSTNFELNEQIFKYLEVNYFTGLCIFDFFMYRYF